MHSYRLSQSEKCNLVLILVLMEDALVPESSSSIQNARATSLNPCFNGRCTRTSDVNGQKVEKSVVLILVLMEDALVQG